MWQLKRYPKISGRVRCDYTFYLKGRSDIDVDNAIASVNDILEAVGIIDDDKLVINGSFEKIGKCSDWNSVIDITRKLPK